MQGHSLRDCTSASWIVVLTVMVTINVAGIWNSVCTFSMPNIERVFRPMVQDDRSIYPSAVSIVINMINVRFLSENKAKQLKCSTDFVLEK